jgi:hypothetical protein
MFNILGFKENLSYPRYLNNSSFVSYGIAEKEKSSIDLGQISVFICSILLSLGGCISIIASSIRRSRCQEILCCGFSKCLRNVPNDPEIAI